MIIAVDFDGTIAFHDYPHIYNEVPHALYWLKEFQRVGAKLMLWTMRSGVHVEWVDEQWKAIDCDLREPLAHAVAWCRERGIEFWAINENPQQTSWAKESRKQYAHVYIDDAAFGCPLIHDEAIHSRPFVDWTQVGQAVLKRIEEYNASR